MWRGRSFQVWAAATGKARSPTVDSRVRWTGSDVVSTDHMRFLIQRSAGWRSSSARYVGAVVLVKGTLQPATIYMSKHLVSKPVTKYLRILGRYFLVIREKPRFRILADDLFFCFTIVVSFTSNTT